MTLCDAGLPISVSWSTGDTVVFSQGSGDILQVSAAGGTPKVLIPLDSTKGEFGFRPEVLPGGEAVLFTLRDT